MTNFFGTPLVVALALPATLVAQSTGAWDETVRVEVGLGAGVVGEGGGLNARVSILVLPSEWGLLVRRTIHDGGEGAETGFIFRFTPKEEFHDAGILLVRVLGSGSDVRFTVGAGVAGFWGRKILEGSTRLDDFGPVVGIPLEVGLYTVPPGLVGGGIVLVGNLNSEATQVGFTVTLTFGRWR